MSDTPPNDSSTPLKRLFLFLLAPSEKVFECIRLDVSSDLGPKASVGDILALAPLKSSEPTLVAQKLVGLCRMIEDFSEKHGGGGGGSSGTDVLTIREQRVSECIIDGELLIAIPAGFTADHCQLLVKRILKKQPKTRKLLQRSDPLAPRNARSSARRKAPSRSAHNSGGMKRSSSMSSMTGLALEAIEEGENESKTSIVTSTRDDANTSFDHESIHKSTGNLFDDNITTTASLMTTDLQVNPNSNNIDPGVIEGDMARRKESEDVASREILASIRRDPDKKLIKEQSEESIEAGNVPQAKIKSRTNASTSEDANEQLLDPDNEDQHAVDHIERLALEASELETSFMSETSISSESPDSPPKKRKLHRTVAKTKGENAPPISAFLPRTQYPADNSSAVPAEEERKVRSFCAQLEIMKQRIKQAKTSAKQKPQLRSFLVTVASVFVAMSSVLYHIWNPYPIGLSAYLVFIVVFVTSAALLQKRKLSIARAKRRRRSRSLSTTPIRKGSIRRIQVAKRASGTPPD